MKLGRPSRPCRLVGRYKEKEAWGETGEAPFFSFAPSHVSYITSHSCRTYLCMHGGTGPIRDKVSERGEGKGACNLLRNPSASTDRSSRGRRRARKDNGVSERAVRAPEYLSAYIGGTSCLLVAEALGRDLYAYSIRALVRELETM